MASGKMARFAGLCAGALAVAALLGFRSDTPAGGTAGQHSPAVVGLSGSAPDLAADEARTIQLFYHARNDRPLWTDGAADRLLRMLAAASEDGLDPQDHSITRIKAAGSKGMRREVALSHALIDYVRALRTPSTANRIYLVDAALASETDATTLLQRAAEAPSISAYLRHVRNMHPLYEQLRTALGNYRRKGINPTPLSGTAYERMLLVNMDRLRAVPADPDSRYILVNSASATMTIYENGKAVDKMPVIVGKKHEQTPSLAGLIRFSVRNPYWNLPPDLIQARAARILSDGPDLLEQERLELLSGWGKDARMLHSDQVDWYGVASGAVPLRMRQKPGPDNMMGAVKFMLPNRLGIYLHDTPAKHNFARKDRLLSSGCVRVADAERLYRWLMRGKDKDTAGTTELYIPVPEPVPVYILYLTATPEGGSVILQNDGYGRDPPRRS